METKTNMSNTLLETSVGAMTLQEAIEDNMQAVRDLEKFERWEAIRDRANTIGVRAALDEAINGKEARNEA